MLSLAAASFFVNQAMLLSLGAGVVGLVVAVLLIRGIFAAPAGNEKMRAIAGAIEEGAKAYLGRQVRTISVIAVLIAILVFFFKDTATAVGFVIGAVCSMIAGFIGMRIAVMANVRTAQGATVNRRTAMRVAFNGGAVTGLLVVGLALLSVALFYLVMLQNAGEKKAVDSLIGLALGASLISVFARLGGGIYTKAADVGADLVGKVEQSLEEDDPRNPATIADNVGDNVGDCAGMAADVFETYAVSLIGAILIGFLTAASGSTTSAVILPFLLGGISIVTSVFGIILVNSINGSPSNLLMGSVLVSSTLSGIAYWPAIHHMFPTAVVIGGVSRTPADVPLLNHWPGPDFCRRADYELLHFDRIFTGAKDRGGVENRSRHEYYRGPGDRHASHRAAGALHRRFDLDELLFRRPLRRGHCRDVDAFDGRHHCVARCLRTHHG